MALKIRPLSYALGAEIQGVNLGQDLSPSTFEEIHSAFLKYGVLLFRSQPLTQEQHLAFSLRFGEADDNERLKLDRDPKYPEILLNTNKPKPGARAGFGYAAAIWHSDLSVYTSPGLATLLRAVKVPEVGGDTMFSNMSMAYDALSDGMKKITEQLFCIYIPTNHLLDYSSPERLAETKRINRPVAHPLVRVHPETGRKSLYFMERVKQFVGMTVEESKPILDFLIRHIARPQFCYRHQWLNDDLLMWDNRCMNHIAINDYDPSKLRWLERISIKGQPSGGYVIPESEGTSIEYIYEAKVLAQRKEREQEVAAR